MDESRDGAPDRQIEFLAELAKEHTLIDNDVFEVDEGTWAIHGVISYGGEVPMAVFNTYEEAQHALDTVRGFTSPAAEGEGDIS